MPDDFPEARKAISEALDELVGPEPHPHHPFFVQEPVVIVGEHEVEIAETGEVTERLTVATGEHARVHESWFRPIVAPMPPEPEGFERTEAEQAALESPSAEFPCSGCGLIFPTALAEQYHQCYPGRTFADLTHAELARVPVYQPHAFIDLPTAWNHDPDAAIEGAEVLDDSDSIVVQQVHAVLPISRQVLADADLISVIEDGREVRVPIESLSPEDRLLREAGERIERAIDVLLYGDDGEWWGDDRSTIDWGKAMATVMPTMNLHQIRLIQTACRLIELGGPES